MRLARLAYSLWFRDVGPPRASLVLVAALVTRSILSWRVVRFVQCSWDGASTLLPLAVFLTELIPRRSFQLPRGAASPDDPTGVARLKQAPFYSLRYLALAIAWAWLASDTFSLLSTPAGAICPSGWWFGPFTVVTQLATVLLDALIITSVAHIKHEHAHDSLSPPSGVLADAAILSTCLLFAFSLFFSPIPDSDNWVFRHDYLAPRDLFLDSGLASAAFLSGIHMLTVINTWTLAATVSGVALYARIWANVLHSPADFHAGMIWVCAVAAPISLALLFKFDGDPPGPRAVRDTVAQKLLAFLSWGLQGALLVLLLMPGSFGVSRQAIPQDSRIIQELIASAQQAFTGWEVQARKSTTVEGLASEYYQRYGIPPPPNFDKWFEYARSQNSAIMDAFDQISLDLRPFWGLTPSALRNRTSHLLEHHELHVGGLRIRDGAVTLSPHVPGTHNWMMQGYIDMIKPFVQWLPDMDLAFNLDDECRVAVPFDQMDDHLYAAEESVERLRQTEPKKLTSWSPSDQLSPPWSDEYLQDDQSRDEVPQGSPFFTDHIRRPVYYSHVAPTCHPASAARNWHWWNKKISCSTCAAPHTITGRRGSYVSKWDLSGDLCHQPDLAYLHGFLLSPAPMIPTGTLFPIFSQGRVGGFSDILVPSPWNFVQKSEYDDGSSVPWSEKNNALFWRGAPSDGFATHSSWVGFLRARFVKSAMEMTKKSLAGSPPPWAHLPDITGVGVNVTFVGPLHKCDGRECGFEHETFYDDAPLNLNTIIPKDDAGQGDSNIPSAVPFEENWKYRHLVDLDGAGFSGRFIPFLQSHSLIYRASLFRTWFDERVHAWKHYVPLDLRLGDGFWELLAFFGKGRGSGMGERIGADGREWAARVLRPEDMQIYMFRLLLEWGRLVDDKREMLGYV